MKGTKDKFFDLDSFLKGINTKKQDDHKTFVNTPSEKSLFVSKNNKIEDSKQPDPPKITKKQPSVEVISDSEDKPKPKISENFDRQHRIFPGCKFCEIIHVKRNKKDDKIIFEDDICAAFHDKNRINSQEHILLCSKSHIKNSHCISKEDIPLLTHLQETGEALLKKRRPNENYRFGYHEPPMNSIEHLHLHCIVLPITNNYLDKVIYGFKLTKTEKIIAKILSGEITPGVYPEKVKKAKK